MVKLDFDRDYYADLELPATADAVEVKKQFKKLALKWHPDRNPGKEDEAKEKFLVIQSAHEILTDPVAKSKVDAHRQRTSRYPAASGVRGNPWQNAAQEANQKFGAPPRRPQMPTRPPAPTAAASTKHWDWAQRATAKTDHMRANMSDAWDRARPQAKPAQPAAAPTGTSARTSKPREPPTPRTASQARRQEAAFGTRKSGYAPASPMGDEPPVRNQHYNTGANTTQTRNPRPSSDFVDPLSSQFSETYLGDRRTPYAANVGEKTNPFEPLNVNRAKSMRDGARRFPGDSGDAPPPPPSRQRSASVDSEGFKKSTNEKPTSKEPGATPAYQFQSRASARYSPRGPATNSAPPTATFPDPNGSNSSVNSSANATVNGHAFDQARNGAKVYEFPFSTSRGKICPTSSAGSRLHPSHSSGRVGAGASYANKFGFPAYRSEERVSVSPTPSGERPSPGANSFETKLHAQLQHLLHSARQRPYKAAGLAGPMSILPQQKAQHWTSKYTNGTYSNSFSVPAGHDPTSPTQHARFTRNSADNINTRFVAEEKGGANFQFSAGAATAADDGFLRAKYRARGHQSPLRNGFTASAEAVNGTQQPETSKQQGDFVPDAWKEAFGAHVFEPQHPGKPVVSPTRPIRPIKKPRPVRMTAGTAGLVDEEGTTSGEDKDRANTSTNGINGSRSPNAMDIDTPPPEPAPAEAHANEPRNIHVEPTKPEWRAGHVNVNGANPEPTLGAGLKAPHLKPTAAGSEDSDDFARPVFSEFRNVEPFAQQSSGLASFADLSANLPFPSRASAKIPLVHEKPQPLVIPSPPAAPRAPPALCIPGSKPNAPAWLNYVREFEGYLGLWLEYNRRVTDHFAARQKVNEARGAGWLNAVGEAAVGDYWRSLEEDKYVRQKWKASCDAHEMHFREFIAVRERLVSG